MLWGTLASAAPNDIRLNRGTGVLTENNGQYSVNQDAYFSLIRDLGYVLGPSLSPEARSIGSSRLELGFEYTAFSVPGQEAHWSTVEATETGATPSNWLHRIDFHVEKGLPYSFSLHAGAGWLVDSSIVMPRLGLRFVPVEGVEGAPDLALGVEATKPLGLRDLSMTIMSLNAQLSKRMNLGRAVEFTPMVAWSVVMPFAGAALVDPTPNDPDDLGTNVLFPSVGPSEQLQHALSLSTQFRVGALRIGVLSRFSMFAGGEALGPVRTISGQMGFVL